MKHGKKFYWYVSLYLDGAAPQKQISQTKGFKTGNSAGDLLFWMVKTWPFQRLELWPPDGGVFLGHLWSTWSRLFFLTVFQGGNLSFKVLGALAQGECNGLPTPFCSPKKERPMVFGFPPESKLEPKKTVDGRNPAITSWGWLFIPLFTGFFYIPGPRWCRISSINRMIPGKEDLICNSHFRCSAGQSKKLIIFGLVRWDLHDKKSWKKNTKHTFISTTKPLW